MFEQRVEKICRIPYTLSGRMQEMNVGHDVLVSARVASSMCVLKTQPVTDQKARAKESGRIDVCMCVVGVSVPRPITSVSGNPARPNCSLHFSERLSRRVDIRDIRSGCVAGLTA